jgi:hypothetical protein
MPPVIIHRIEVSHYYWHGGVDPCKQFLGQPRQDLVEVLAHIGNALLVRAWGSFVRRHVLESDPKHARH